MNVTSIVLEAQKILVMQPFDLAHDITHHYRVYENCISLIDAEKLNIEKELITICAWWHDVGDRKGANTGLLSAALDKYKFDEEVKNKILATIKEHSYGLKQQTIESKVLFDADKLEYASPFRLSLFIQATRDGFLSMATYNQYQKEWHDRIEKVRELLHFTYSKSVFEYNLPLAYKIMNKGL